MVAAGQTTPKFPALLFGEALARMRAFEAKVPAGAAVPRQAVLKALGYEEKNGAAMRTLNALRRYGLLDRSSEGYRISDVCSRILRPVSPQDERAARMLAAWTPEVFGRLRDRYGPDPTPDGEVRRWLVELGVPPGVCTRLIKVYRDVVAEVGCKVSTSSKSVRGAAPSGAAASPRADHAVLFEYRMVDGAVVSIDLAGETDHAEVLHVIEAWIAFKKSEIARLSQSRSAADR